MTSNHRTFTRSTGLTLILNTPKGRGVFASQDIPARTILEVSPVLVLESQREREVREEDGVVSLYNNTEAEALKEVEDENEILSRIELIDLTIAFLF
ncbi:hypothetical protein EYC84_005820 [Monilinia fructicola]|uniref:SET domain-containing protein n=1 Tax=Monilinia fructicola TaxID=38448 RepID=A0A5M9K0P0_MONFR|nr:hypothetical protein EYC84_005820 [Monilinia fructicola]